jgi:hypothetical protein
LIETGVKNVKQKNKKQWLHLTGLIAALTLLVSCDLPEEDNEEEDFFNNVVKISQLMN